MAIDALLPAADRLPAPAAEPAHFDREMVEDARLQSIFDALPDAAYGDALALGAAPGLTRKLARRCARVSVSKGVAQGLPHSGFDLIVVCDAFAGLSQAELRAAASRIVDALRPGGQIVLTHWIDERGADEGAASFVRITEEKLLPISRQRTPHYRLDVLERA